MSKNQTICVFSLLALTLATVSASPARAQGEAAPPPPAQGSSNCPPGSWFCGDAPSSGANGAPGSATGGATGSGAASSSTLQPLPGAPGAPGAAPSAPPVVVYSPAPAIVVEGRAEQPPPYHYRVRPAAPRRSEWGLTLRLEGAMIGRRANTDAGMGGIGFGVRYKPVPFFGIGADLDFFGGKDYNGFRRTETAFTLNGLFFVNPRSKVQVFIPVGFGWSGAHAVDDYDHNPPRYYGEYNYSYFGGQAGVGVEFRVAKHFALDVALLGFVRGRTDDSRTPEFRDASGRTSNTSGGALLQGGMTIYF